jgi:RNA polymerase sigma-70 factor, ECF subfamily
MDLATNGTDQALPDGAPMDRAEELVRHITVAQKALFAYISIMLGSGRDADDVLQQVNLVLWRRGHEYDGRGPFLTWACHIAYLQVLAHRKKCRRERQTYFDEAVLADLAGCAAEEVERIDDRIEALRACLGKLSASQRQLILGRYEAGGSVQKLASELDRPAGSVSVTLHRIRKLLSACIERTLAEGGAV